MVIARALMKHRHGEFYSSSSFYTDLDVTFGLKSKVNGVEGQNEG